MKISDASTLAELVEFLKTDGGHSNESLGAAMGIGATTVHRMLLGNKVDDKTLDKLATFAHVPREWVYQLAKGIQQPTTYSPIVTMIAELLENAPADIQELFLVQTRAVLEDRKKHSN